MKVINRAESSFGGMWGLTKPQISVVLPTFNEKENIGALIQAISQSVEPAPEIVVVDDSSPDGTGRIVANLERDLPNLKLHVRRERGLASALAKGVTLATGDYITWMDCDFSHPPFLLPRMLEAMDHVDVVVASRYMKGGSQEYPFIRSITSRAFNIYANLWLGFAVHDWTSGYAMVRREVFEKVTVRPLGQGYGEYFVGLMFDALQKGFKVKEIPYRCVYNHKHESKTSTNIFKLLKYGVSYGTTVPQLRWQTLRGEL
ncbi:MAG: polyprenol monophosphomannose synthase [Chloroflexi bacterium]|nr:polyprenol monophosphomannose synthase [Chloroflexota bacterium]